MKALLDEQLSSRLALELRRRGLDVEAVAERVDLIGLADDRLMDVAAAEGRALVTNNIKDFRPIAARRLGDGHGHAGLILLPATRSRSRAAIGGLADDVEAIMRANPKGLADSERWLPATT